MQLAISHLPLNGLQKYFPTQNAIYESLGLKKCNFVKDWEPKCKFEKVWWHSCNFEKFWGQNCNLRKVCVNVLAVCFCFDFGLGCEWFNLD